MMASAAGPTRRTAAQNDALILRILHDAAAPYSAYEIALRTQDYGFRLAPARVYRTLERLIAHRQAVRIETYNGYSASLPGTDLHLICTHCRSVTSLACPAVLHGLRRLAACTGFTPCRAIVEVPGLCASCQLSPAPGPSVPHACHPDGFAS